MKIALLSEKSKEKPDLILIPYWEEKGAASSFHHPELKALLDTHDFKGKLGETALFYAASLQGARILLLGLGKKGQETSDSLRRAFASGWKKAVEKKAKRVQVVFPKVEKVEFQAALTAVCEALCLSNYAYDRFKKEKVELPQQLLFSGVERKWEKEIDRLEQIAQGVHFVRDLVNGNADEINPSRLAKEALAIGKANSAIKVAVLDKKQLEKEGMALLLAVGQGAVDEPKMIVASYRGDPKSKALAVLVGKGITFDTGGLSLKPTDNMLTMKCDMAGAATVLGAIKVAAELKLQCNLTVLLPVAENAIGSRSYKVGDVFSSCSGKTVEVQNTDAEGRLILADALSYAVKHLKPTRLIDLGTLTGAIVVALGEEIAGLYANDEKIAKGLEKASAATGEMLWRMPLYDYKESLHSEIADLSNVGGREAGSIKCALFLQEFVEDTPWAHIDMAGPAYLSKPKHHNPARGTGWGLRLLIDYLEEK